MQGPTGPTGAGAQGSGGQAGPAGTDGIDGIDGMPGADGTDGIDGIDGMQGAQGPTGPSGGQSGPLTLSPEFDPYTSWENDKFEPRTKGAQGSQGAIGRQGPTGQQGPAGSSATTETAGSVVARLSNAVANSNTIYYSLDYHRLVYKDTDGDIFALTGNKPIKPNVKEDHPGPQF